jgi:hypothetical protein
MDNITTVDAIKAFLERSHLPIHRVDSFGSVIVWLNDLGNMSTGVQFTSREYLAVLGQPPEHGDQAGRIDLVDGNGAVWAGGVSLDHDTVHRLQSSLERNSLAYLEIPERLIGEAASAIEDDRPYAIYFNTDRGEWNHSVKDDYRVEGLTLAVTRDGLEPDALAAAIEQHKGHEAARTS